MATAKTHQQVFEGHLQGLLETERTLSAESRRVECGLIAVRRQIAVERQALAAASGSSGTAFPATR